MLALISSVPVATVCTFLLTCSAAAETTPACVAVSSALLTICWLLAASSSEAELERLGVFRHAGKGLLESCLLAHLRR